MISCTPESSKNLYICPYFRWFLNEIRFSLQHWMLFLNVGFCPLVKPNSLLIFFCLPSKSAGCSLDAPFSHWIKCTDVILFWIYFSQLPFRNFLITKIYFSGTNEILSFLQLTCETNCKRLKVKRNFFPKFHSLYKSEIHSNAFSPPLSFVCSRLGKLLVLSVGAMMLFDIVFLLAFIFCRLMTTARKKHNKQKCDDIGFNIIAIETQFSFSPGESSARS